MAGKVRYPLIEYAPELASEYASSNKIPIEKVGRGSTLAAIWICHRCNKEFPFPKTPTKRFVLYKKHNRIGDCPFCGDLASERLSDSYNFAVLFPMYARHWDYEKNNSAPEEHMPFETGIFHFKCRDNPLHIWQQQLYKRAVSKLPCPICGGKRPGDGHCLADIYPDISAEWSQLNEITPFEVNPKSGIEYWWQCENSDHPPYQMTVEKKYVMELVVRNANQV